jgi:hypothetical protein
VAHSAEVASAAVVVQVAASAVAVASVVEAVAAAAQAVVVDDLPVALFTSSIRFLII